MRSIPLVLCLLAGNYLTAFTAPLTVTPTTTLTAERGNNTSAADVFVGTTNGDIAAGNVSKMSIRSMLYSGSTTKVYANWVPWWGGSNHINIGYSSSDPTEVHRQVSDMISRGIDGIVVDWYSSGSLDRATVVMRQEIEKHPGFVFALMPDSGAYGGLADPTQKLINDVNYAAGSYFLSPNYMKVNGQPALFPFGLEQYPIDWTRVMANIQGNPIFIFRNVSGFSYADSSGGYAWGPSSAGNGYWDFFYPSAIKTKMATYGSVSKGFNDSLASWGQNRFVDQQCGQRWLSTFAEANKYYSASLPLPYMQLVTWNDYEEGTEIESGVDNCVSLSSQMVDSQLNWTVAGQENTIDHYTVFISVDGENLMNLADVPVGTHAIDLAQYALAPADYTLYVKAVGKASIRNQISNPTSYQSADGITASPQSLNVQGAFHATVQIGVNSPGASNAVALSVSGLPSGVTASFAPTTVTGSGSSVLTLASAASIPTGSYPLVVMGTSGSGAMSGALTLTVALAPGASPDFSMAVAGPGTPIHAGQSTSYTLAMSSQNGFAGNVSFACSGLPAGATCNFSSNPLMLSGSNSSATLQIVTTGQTASLIGGSLGGSTLAFLCFGGFSVFGMFLAGGNPTPRKFPALAVLLSAVMLMGVGCGGNVAPPSNTPAVTPSGTYTVTVTATSGSVQHSAMAQIVVQ